MSFRSIVFAASFVWPIASSCVLPAGAQVAPAVQTPGAIAGTVVDQQSGLPIAGATVALVRGDAAIAHATTGSRGDFTFASEPPGLYVVEISAVGFGTSRSEPIALASGGTARVNSAISAQTTGSAAPRTIAQVSTAATGGSALQRSTVISTNVSADLIRAEGYSRVGDALVTLPGINPSPAGVHGSTIGYSLPLDIRGIGSNETQVLFDGHPVGANGANAFPGQAFFNQAPVLFDFQNSPSDALRNVQTTYGSGAVGLYGVDSIGGVIDQQSIDPTPVQHATITQGIGSYGKALTNVQLTGTQGKLGYAIAGGVQGTYGEFAPQQLAQTGLLGSDQTSANLASKTYEVSGNYEQRDSFAKARYDFSNATKLTLTGYSATSYADKSGNGDNDFATFDEQLLIANNLIAGIPAHGPTTVVGTNGATFACAAGIAAVTDAHPNGVCETARQYAAATTGPQGGGNGPFQALRNQDYHARLTTTLGKQSLAFDTFVDDFGGIYDRTANFNGSSYENVVITRGFLVSDDYATATNDVGIGYYGQTQKIAGSQQVLSTSAAGTPFFTPVTNAEVDANVSNFFLRDAYAPANLVSFFFNGWVKYNSVSRSTAFDPRVSIVLKPTGHDVVRLTGGRSTDQPFAGLKAQSAQFNSSPTNIQPACNGLTNVGSAGNPNIESVTGTDLEFSYGHSFRDDTQLQASVYNTTLRNPIFNSTFSATAFATNPSLANLIALLNAPGGRYVSLCNTQATPANLSVSGPVNVAGGAFRGVNLGGRYRFTRHVYADANYNVQTAVFTGVPDAILQSNPFLINDRQIAGIPQHTGTFALDYSNARGGNELRLDGNYVSANNSYFTGPYAFFNGFVRQSVGRETTLTIGGYNVFNAYADKFGRIGAGQFQPENHFFTDTTVAQEAVNEGLPENIGEQFGLPPPQITFSASVRL